MPSYSVNARRNEMRIVHLILISILMPVNAFAQYIVYESATGKIIGTTPSPALEKGQTALLYTGPELRNLNSIKIVNGAVVDNEEYGRKIVLMGDTELLADGKDTGLITVILSDRNGNIIANMDRTLKVKTERGKANAI